MQKELAVICWERLPFLDGGLDLRHLFHCWHFLEEDGFSQLFILYAGVYDLKSIMHELQLWLIRLLAYSSQRESQELWLQNFVRL